MNLPPAAIATAGVDTYKDILHRIEDGGEEGIFNGGYDITPTRRLFIESRIGKFDGERFASQVHQTWPKGYIRGTKLEPTLRSMLANHAAYTLMPEVYRGLPGVRLMSDQLGGVPVCVYPTEYDFDGTPMQYKRYSPLTAAQITPEAMDEAGGRDNYRAFHDFLWRLGVIGVIVDNHHIMRGGLDAEKILQNVRETGTNVFGLHAAAGRYDSKVPAERERSQRDLVALLKGPEAIGRSAMGEVLAEGYAIALGQRHSAVLPAARLGERQAAIERSIEEHMARIRTERAELVKPYEADPLELQYSRERDYLRWLSKRFGAVVSVSLELPYGGLKAHREGRLSRADFYSMTRDAGRHLHGFFASL